MKKQSLFLFALIALFASCNDIEDPRNKPIPDDPQSAFLLGVEIDKVPEQTNAYVGSVFNVNNPDNEKVVFMDTTVALPIYHQIPGGKFVGSKGITGREYGLTLMPFDKKTGEIGTTLIASVPTFEQLKEITINGNDTTYTYNKKHTYEEGGWKYTLHFRYD